MSLGFLINLKTCAACLSQQPFGSSILLIMVPAFRNDLMAIAKRSAKLLLCVPDEFSSSSFETMEIILQDSSAISLSVTGRS